MEVMLSTDSDEQMPPKGKRVPPEQIALLKAVDRGGDEVGGGFCLQKARV
jgi:hypothetical protein